MRLSWYRQRLRLKHPFRIARGIEVEKETIVVRIEHEGLAGFGEVVPTAYYGQSLESAERALEQMEPILGEEPFKVQHIVDCLVRHFPDQSAAVAGVDAALHDWVGKRLSVPVWRLLGLDAQRMPPTSFTIGIDEPETIEQKVAEAADFPILKVKLGTPFDEEILKAVRRAAPDKVVRVDANAGWTPDEAVKKVRMCADYGVEFVEQPIPPGDAAALERIQRASPLPIVVDESAVRPEDLPVLAGCVCGINIKLCKCGGIRRALQMIFTARSLGLKVMLGCMVGSSLYISAAAHLGPLADWLDLDGHLLLAEDPFDGLAVQAGRLLLSDEPGLGVRVPEG